MSEHIQVGDRAPDFTLKNQDSQEVSLTQLLEKGPVVLAFYPLDFSPVCSGECAAFTKDLPQFQSAGAQVVGISVDSPWCHKAFKDAHKISFPLLSDFHPKGEVAKKYGLYFDAAGITQRATVIVGKDGIVKFVKVQEIRQARDNSEILQALKS